MDIQSLKLFGDWLNDQTVETSAELQMQMNRQYEANSWLIPDFVSKELNSCAHFLLHDIEKIEIPNIDHIENIGLIIFQNIPLAGFREVLLLVSLNQNVWVRDDDKNFIVLKYLLNKLTEIVPEFKDRIHFISTFSRDISKWIYVTDKRENNPSLVHYLSLKKCLTINQPESAIQFTGKENDAELEKVAAHVFTYWGFHADNIRKIFVPQGYVFNRFFEVAEKYCFVYNFNRYANNYDYHKSVYLMDRKPFLDNGFLVVFETVHMGIPVGCLGYQYYDGTGISADQEPCCLKSINDLQETTPGIGNNSFFIKEECPRIIQFIIEN
jgi:hypothetical protein